MAATRGAEDRTVVGVFEGPGRAEAALTALRDAEFVPAQVSILARDEVGAPTRADVTSEGAEGARTGAVLGGVTGGALGWLVGIGALVIPGAGPLLAAGALATALGGAALGAVAGGLIGALVDLGVPEDDARGYQDSLRAGQVLLTVRAATDEQAWTARSLFELQGGVDVRVYGIGSEFGAGDDVAARG